MSQSVRTTRAPGLIMRPQPTDDSCGAACLQALYAYYGDLVPMDQLIAEVPHVPGGGTLGALLGIHALRRGYRARLHTLNLRVFDPSWFYPVRQPLEAKLQAQVRCRSGKRRLTARAYLKFLQLGGEIRFEDLTPTLLQELVQDGTPVLTGLSATWLYRASREHPATTEEDDIRGEPTGHFVVLNGYLANKRAVVVADPYTGHPFGAGNEYEVPVARLLNAILLGVLTYDGNLLTIFPNPPAGDDGPNC